MVIFAGCETSLAPEKHDKSQISFDFAVNHDTLLLPLLHHIFKNVITYLW